MNNKMYSVSCDPMCGFMVKSHDKNEAVNHAYQHVSSKHAEKKLTRDQVMSSVKEN
jgi:predicted small metal-binding protein